MKLKGGSLLARNINIRNITDNICIPGRPYADCFNLHITNEAGFNNPCIQRLASLAEGEKTVLSLAAVDCGEKGYLFSYFCREVTSQLSLQNSE